MLVIKSYEIVWFHYQDGTQGAWCKLKGIDGLPYGNYNRTQWIPSDEILTPLEYTEALELANENATIEYHLKQLKTMYILSKKQRDDNV